jgi:hypothetical protein
MPLVLGIARSNRLSARQIKRHLKGSNNENRNFSV